jgi:hypothetical protein
MEKQLSKAQIQAISNLLDNADIAQVFEQLDQYGIKNTTLNILKKEFIFGVFRYDYYERLQTYLNTLADTDFRINQENHLQGLEAFTLRRLKTLEKHIDEAFVLLEETESQERLAASPSERKRMQLEMSYIKENLRKYETEYKELSTK